MKKNLIILTVCILLATLVAGISFKLTGTDANVALIYALAVLLIARFSTGYLPGIAASVICVIIVNCVFTYPYGQVNFTLAGYPITFIGMLSISVVTSTVMSHLKSQSERLQEQERLLMEAEKEKMRANLLRAISHDLRTPLTAIIGSSSAYLENKDILSESEQDMLVSRIHEDANWLLNMVENLLTVTRINADTADVAKTEEPVEEVVGEAVMRLKKRMPGLAIKVKVPDELYMIPMDATLIEQVIINLLENAALHSGTVDPIELTVRPQGAYMCFEVVDYGKGIEEDRIAEIFDGGSSYSGSDSADTHKGMGIGLSICKTIINAHHGVITAENHGHGARFSFSLPLTEASDKGKK